ncbi:uncharacterized protein si:dkey-106l3.7 isoform X1 [Siniperca chuatsi]|uniref:uncharacterized protein si:dkey-106l3.7 isoform X1 n=1 Tax=Siniperca chuatsi TaxID=119488 RepID=UPI001CE159B3|nr:uncharacterized protein si:dkey-106l3.7 isoform X1 [Siniperca chuatsi]
MNLYRTFGNLMEAWVREEGQCSDSDWLRNNDEDSPTPSSDTGTNLRSESVDSGVETASSDTSFPAASCSVSTDNTEIDTFTPEREGDRFTPASTSQSPVFSSPVPSSSSSFSSRLCPSRAQEASTILHQKVEQTLQRTDSEHLKDNIEPLTVDEVLRRRPQAPFLPKRHYSELVRGQRSDSFGLRRTVNPSVPMRQMCRRPMSMSCDKQPAQTRLEDLGEQEGKGLSPGLSYLEQVCQMLEEIARQQMHTLALQMETNALREHQHAEALDNCQSDSKVAEEDLSSCQRLENTESAEHSSSEPQQRKDYLHRHRQRSASDTTIATLHLRKLNADCRGHRLSTDNRMEKVEEDHEKQESEKEEMIKTKKNWKLKIGSLRREESAVRDTDGQQMQPSEKNSARRRLSQLFRRNRRKTLPV